MTGLSNKYKGLSGVEPTAEEIGAVPLAGGTMTGTLTSPRFYSETNQETITVAKTLIATDKQNQVLRNNTSALDVNFPTATTNMAFQITNDPASTFNLVLKTSGGTTIITIAPGVSVGVLYTGTQWIYN